MKKTILSFVLCLSLVTLFAQESVELKNAGNEALKVKDYAKALENFEKSIAVWGTGAQDFAMIYNTAYCALQLKDYEKAIKYFDQCIAGNYKAEDVVFNKVIVYRMQKNNEEYLKMLNEGIAKFPESTKFVGELSKYYLLEGNSHYASGATVLKSAIEKITSKKYKDTNDPLYKADLKKSKEEFAAAIPLLAKSLELNPTNENAKAIKAACEKQLKAL